MGLTAISNLSNGAAWRTDRDPFAAAIQLFLIRKLEIVGEEFQMGNGKWEIELAENPDFQGDNDTIHFPFVTVQSTATNWSLFWSVSNGKCQMGNEDGRFHLENQGFSANSISPQRSKSFRNFQFPI